MGKLAIGDFIVFLSEHALIMSWGMLRILRGYKAIYRELPLYNTLSINTHSLI